MMTGSLNGDILFWSEELQMPMELSSMGIRVSPESLIEQLKLSNCEHRLEYPFHRALADGKLLYHRRRYRTEQTMYASITKGAHRRGAVLLLGRGHDRYMQKRRR